MGIQTPESIKQDARRSVMGDNWDDMPRTGIVNRLNESIGVVGALEARIAEQESVISWQRQCIDERDTRIAELESTIERMIEEGDDMVLIIQNLGARERRHVADNAKLLSEIADLETQLELADHDAKYPGDDA